MDKLEAQEILSQHVARISSYADLVPLVESRHIEKSQVAGPGGVNYQVVVRFFWQDNEIRRNIRVVGSIAEGGARGSLSLTQTMLVPPPQSVI
ncbi:MAG: hypothetical protein ACLQU3_20570 [Limisphaerales bacterium]